jgi:hypothetical protein
VLAMKTDIAQQEHKLTCAACGLEYICREDAIAELTPPVQH